MTRVLTHVASNGETFGFDTKTGIGYLRSNASDDLIYDQAYWDNYVARSNTPIGWALNGARMDLLDKGIQLINTYHIMDCIVDVGIGSGAFVDRYICQGYDVNPVAVEWLERRADYYDPYQGTDVITMWDVIEHIADPGPLLNSVGYAVVLSTPIYRDFEHCIASKHFKPNEHIWYFTDDGIKNYMEQYGFVCAYQDQREVDCGREDIGSYVFIREKYK